LNFAAAVLHTLHGELTALPQDPLGGKRGHLHSVAQSYASEQEFPSCKFTSHLMIKLLIIT